MRPQKRSRGRNGGGNPYHNNQNRGPRPPHRIQTFDSNGPNVKIRGNAYQVFERYLALAREAQSSGDRVAAENFFQHAEHYFRVMNANGEGLGQGQPRPQQTPNEGGFPNGGEGEQPEEQHQAYNRQPQEHQGHEHQDHNHQDHNDQDHNHQDRDHQGHDHQQAHVQIQRAPPPQPIEDDDQLPSFITGRPE
jgi:hypothetical protein